MLDRIHILEGRQLVLLNIDEVIAHHPQQPTSPKPALIARFKLSERQAEDILEIRLRQLARLEAIKIEQELKELRDEQGKLEEILGSPAALQAHVVKEIEADAKQFGDERRTLIQAEKRAVAEVRVVDEPVTVVVSMKGWVRALKGHEVDPASSPSRPATRCTAPSPAAASTRCWSSAATAASTRSPVGALPGGRGDGQPITTLIELESRHAAGALLRRPRRARCCCWPTPAASACWRGPATWSRGSAAARPSSTLEADEKPLPPVGRCSRAHDQVACLTLDGRLLVFGARRAEAAAQRRPRPDADRPRCEGRAGQRRRVRRRAADARHRPRRQAARGSLRGAALEPHVGRRARKGRRQDAMPKAMRVVAASNA